MKDHNEIILLLHTLRQPTFFTRDHGFYHPTLLHTSTDAPLSVAGGRSGKVPASRTFPFLLPKRLVGRAGNS